MNSLLQSYFKRDDLPQEIEEADIEDLAKAKRKMLILPLATFGITYIIRNFRDKVFVSSNFLINMMNVRGKYSKADFKSTSISERMEELKSSEDPYKQIKGKILDSHFS